MQSNVILLVVENRDQICTQYTKFLTTQAWNRTVQQIHFWEGKRARPVWFMRQQMIEQALKTEATHILFVDTDVIPCKGYLEKLLSANADLISGVYCDNQGRPINRKYDTPFFGSGIQEVDVFSMGLSLIKREVFEKVRYLKPTPIDKPDSDVEFCKAVKRSGYKVMVNFDVRGLHLIIGEF